jgi:hypothetical protein
MLKLIAACFIAAAIHCRQQKEDNREDTERKVELATIFNTRCPGSHKKVAKSLYLFYTVIPQHNENLENKLKLSLRQLIVISKENV